MTDTNQASEDELREKIERILRFNCPDGCDGNGSYPEMSADGEWEQGQCQWCFEYGMPARDAIQSLIRTEKLKLLAEVRERVIGENERGTITDPDSPSYGEPYESTTADKEELRAGLDKLEAEL